MKQRSHLLHGSCANPQLKPAAPWGGAGWLAHPKNAEKTAAGFAGLGYKGGDNCISPRKIPEGEIPPPSQIPKLTLPHAHTALPTALDFARGQLRHRLTVSYLPSAVHPCPRHLARSLQSHGGRTMPASTALFEI